MTKPNINRMLTREDVLNTVQHNEILIASKSSVDAPRSVRLTLDLAYIDGTFYSTYSVNVDGSLMDYPADDLDEAIRYFNEKAGNR